MSTHLQQLQAERALVDAAMIIDHQALLMWVDYKMGAQQGPFPPLFEHRLPKVPAGKLRARAWVLDAEMEWLTR